MPTPIPRLQLLDVETHESVSPDDVLSADPSEVCLLAVDGVIVAAEVGRSVSSMNSLTAFFPRGVDYSPLLPVPLRELGLLVKQVELDVDDPWIGGIGPMGPLSATVKLGDSGRPRAGQTGRELVQLRLAFYPPVTGWAMSWSIEQAFDALRTTFSPGALPGVMEISANEYPCVWFHFDLTGVDATVGSVLEIGLRPVREAMEQARLQLDRRHQVASISTAFQFPESVRSACEQYLMYFGQFLRDLGIDATTEIREEASQVLFNVSPANGEAALAQIREALTAFLALADSPGFDDAASQSNDIAALQLAANVSHLRSQLALSQAVLQAKDAAIEAFQLSNSMLRRQLQLPGAARPTSDDAQEPVGPYLAVREVEKSGVVLRLPNIVRDLKRRLK